MSLGRNAIIVTVASVSGQLIQLAALPIVSRFAPPEAFGVFALFAGLCAFFAVFAGLRYDTAIIVASSDRQGRGAVALMSVLGALTSGLVFVVGIGIAAIGQWFDMRTSLLLAGSGSAWLGANTVVRAATNWLVRTGRFEWIGFIQFFSIVLTVLGQLALLACRLDPVVALAGGFAAGQVLCAVIALLGPGRQAYSLPRFTFRNLIATARYFVNFPRYMVLYGLNTQIRDRAVQIIIGSSAGADSLGRFAMTQRLVSAPQGFLSAGIGPALLNYARVRERDTVAATAVAVMEFSWLMLAPLWLFAAFNAEFIFDHFFSAQWHGVGLTFQLLTAPYLLLCCTSFIDRLYEFYGHQRAALHVEAAYTGVILLVLGALSHFRSEAVLVWAFAITFSLYSLFWTRWTFHMNGLPPRPLAPAFVRVGSITAALVIANLLVMETVMNFWLRAAIIGAAIACVYLVYWRWFGAKELITGVLRSR